MTKPEKLSKLLWRANIYNACNDEYVRNVKLDPDALLRSKYHKVSMNKVKQRKVLLDTRAPDFEDVFIEKGAPMGPDDILEALKPLALKIPVPSRDEVPNLPLSDLLKALHYYSSFTGLREHSCDETALLSLGMLVEQWADELVTEEYAKMFADVDQPEEQNLPEENENLEIEPHIDRSDSEESDLISLDLEYSDNEDFGAEEESARVESPKQKRESLFLQQSSEDDSSDSSESDNSSSDSDSSSGSLDADSGDQAEASSTEKAESNQPEPDKSESSSGDSDSSSSSDSDSAESSS